MDGFVAGKVRGKEGGQPQGHRQHWSVEGEELVNDGHGMYLTTEKNYGDFELLVDYKTVAKADSGIYLRGIPQVQIWDYSKEGGKWNIGADKGSGGLWNNSKGAPGKDPSVLADKPFGEWNSFRIVMVGERVSIWLNGKLVVNHVRLENYFNRKGPLPRTGPIQLQTHGGEIRWRNVFIREIGTEEGNKLLASKERKASRRFLTEKILPDGLAPPTTMLSTMVQSSAKRAVAEPFITTRICPIFLSASNTNCRRVATTDWRSDIRAVATRPTWGCANFKCWTTRPRNTPSFTRRSTMPPLTVWWRPSVDISDRLAIGISSRSRLWVPRSPSR